VVILRGRDSDARFQTGDPQHPAFLASDRQVVRRRREEIKQATRAVELLQMPHDCSDLLLVRAAAHLVSERHDGRPNLGMNHGWRVIGKFRNQGLEEPHLTDVSERAVLP
jgi:hypothetical protein